MDGLNLLSGLLHWKEKMIFKDSRRLNGGPLKPPWMAPGADRGNKMKIVSRDTIQKIRIDQISPNPNQARIALPSSIHPLIPILYRHYMGEFRGFTLPIFSIISICADKKGFLPALSRAKATCLSNTSTESIAKRLLFLPAQARPVKCGAYFSGVAEAKGPCSSVCVERTK